MTNVYVEEHYRDTDEQQQAEDIGYDRIHLSELVRYSVEHHLQNTIFCLLAGVLGFAVRVTQFASRFALATIQLQTQAGRMGEADTK